MNYAELVQAIKDYTDNQEATFVANIPVFVQQTEQRIYRAVLIPELRKNVSGTMATGNRYLARPSDFLAPFSLAVINGSGSYSYLYDKDMNFMREAYPDPSVTGLPKYYAQFDGDVPTATGNFLLGPTPDGNYAVELQYYYDPPSIVTQGSSWLGENAEGALLYGSLIEAYIFMKGDPDVLSSYQRQYDDAMAKLGVVDQRSKRDSYRDGEARME